MKPNSASLQPQRRPMPHLEREKVLDAALELLNETGFEGLTLRRLADRLGVKAAALYWHFTNKQDLINHMAARVFTREFDTDEAALARCTWREILSGMGHGFFDALMRYRDGGLLIASADLTQTLGEFRGRELVIRELSRKGLSSELIFAATFSIIRYALGFAVEAQADPRRHAGAPTLQHFETGLDLILDGVEKKFTAEPGRPGTIES